MKLQMIGSETLTDCQKSGLLYSVNKHAHIKKGEKSALLFLLLSLYVFLFLPLNPLFAQTAVKTDRLPPIIRHNPLQTTLSVEDPVILQANIHDSQTVTEVLLFYRSTGKSDYTAIKMERVSEINYLTIIPQRFVLLSTGIEYYIQASDAAGNLATQGTANAPLTITFKQPTTEVANKTSNTALLANKGGAFRLNAENKTKTGKKPWYKKWWVWSIAIGVIAGAAAASSGGGGGSSPEPASTGTGTVSAGIP